MVDILYKKDTNRVEKLLEKEELNELLDTVKAFEHASQYEVYDALSALALNYVKLTLFATGEVDGLLEMNKEALEIIRAYEDKGTIELAVAYERLRALFY